MLVALTLPMLIGLFLVAMGLLGPGSSAPTPRWPAHSLRRCR